MNSDASAPSPSSKSTMRALLPSIARLHIVAIGALGTLTFSWALCGVRDVPLAMFSACDWFVVNLLNRIVDVVEDQHNGIAGADVVARHSRRTLLVGVGVLVASLVCSAVVAPKTLPIRLAFHALGFAYNWRLLPAFAGGRRRRIKELVFWKNTASALGFLFTCFALPLVSHVAIVSVEAIVAAAFFFFLFELSFEVLYDLRDIEGDRLAGVMTWPVVFGAVAAGRIAVGQAVAALFVVVVSFALGVLPWHLAIMGVAPLMQLAVVAQYLPTATRQSRVTSSLCIEITWAGCGLLVAYHLWEALGLPGSGR